VLVGRFYFVPRDAEFTSEGRGVLTTPPMPGLAIDLVELLAQT
jgi:hypothetical protein